MSKTDEMLKTAEKIQKEMHVTVESMMAGNKKLQYQDCVNVYLVTRIADLLNQVQLLTSVVQPE